MFRQSHSRPGSQLLFKAVKQNDPSKLMDLVLLTHCDPRTIRNERQETLLHVACQRKDDKAIDMVRALVEIYQCNPFSRDEQSSTAYHYACLSGNLNVLCYLFRSKHYNYVNNDTLHPVHLKYLNRRESWEFNHELLVAAGKSGSVAMTRFFFMICKHESGIEDLKLNLYNDALNVLCKMIDSECTGHSLNNDNRVIKAAYEACCYGDLSVLKFYLEEVHVSMPCSKYSFLQSHQMDDDDRSMYASLLRAAYRLGNLHIARYITAVKGFDPLQNAGHRTCILESSDDFDTVTSGSLGSPGGFRYRSTFESSLHTAIRCGNMQAIEDMITQGIHYTNEDDTLLHSACISGKMEMVKIIVDQFKCSVNTCNQNGDTPLHVTCEWGHLAICLFLLEQQGCSIDVTNNCGHTPLMLAIKHNRLKLFQALLSRGASISLASASESDAENSLHLACSQKVSNFAFECLLKSKEVSLEYLNACDKHGDTPLFNACRTGNIEVVKCVISHTLCETLFVNKYTSETPAHIACRMKRLDILDLLLSRSLERPLTLCLNHQQKSLLHLACENDAEDIVEYLIQNQIDCGSNQDCYGHTPIHVAFMRGNTFIAKKLLESKVCKVTDVDRDNNTVLHYMCRNTLVNPDLLKVLIIEDAGNLLLSKINKDENNPLHFVCRNNGIQLLQLLLQHFCRDNLNTELCSRNRNGDTPLHLAFRCLRIALIHFLLNNAELAKGVLNAISMQNCRRENILHLAMEYFYNLKSPTYNCDGTLLRQNSYLIEVLVQSAIFKENEKTMVKILCQTDSDKYTPFQYILKGCDDDRDSSVIIRVLSYFVDSKSLSQESKQCILSVASSNGDTLLHLATAKSNYNVVKWLVEQQFFDPTSLNNSGESALHKIDWHTDNGEKIGLFLCHSGFDPHLLDNSGNSPLLNIVKSNVNFLAKFIDLKERYWKPELPVLRLNCEDTYYSQYYKQVMFLSKSLAWSTISPLALPLPHCLLIHLSDTHKLEMVSRAMGNHNETSLLDSFDNTVLHLCAVMILRDYHLPQTLLKVNANVQNCEGNTPLHIACKAGRNAFIETLIESHKCVESLSLKNREGKTPLYYLSDRRLIELLVLNGADPVHVSELQSVQHIKDAFEKAKKDHPLYPTVAALVLGNSKAGKTTLIKSLTRKYNWENINQPSIGQIKAECTDLSYKPTAGIEISEYRQSESDTTRILFYDFAGHREFHISHSNVLQNLLNYSSAESSDIPLIMFVIVVDIRSPDRLDQVSFWTNFINNCCRFSSVTAKPDVVIVGSHVDQYPERYRKIKKALDKRVDSLSHCFKYDYYATLLNCCEPHEHDLGKLQTVLTKCTAKLKKCEDLNARCHIIFAFIYQHFPNEPVKFSELQTKLNEQERSNSFPLCFTRATLISLLKTMHHMQHMLLIGPTTDQASCDFWILTAIARRSILGDIEGVLFAGEDFDKSMPKMIKSNTGVISSVVIKGLFPDVEYEMLQQFLVYSEFCKKIEDRKVLSLIENATINFECTDSKEEPKSATVQTISDSKPLTRSDESYLGTDVDYFFFPNFVKGEYVDWKQSRKFSYLSGWCLEVTDDTHFNALFLQVLLLRLTFQFATVSMPDSTLHRKCNIWKNGISWSIQGVEMLVEVIDQNQAVIVLVQCFEEAELKAVQLRSSVLKEISNVKAKHCPATKTKEYIIDHPILDENGSLVRPNIMIDICELATAICDGEHHVQSTTCQHHEIENLLCFEPYVCARREKLKELFDSEKEDNSITKEKLKRLLISDANVQSRHFHKLVDKLGEPVVYERLQELFDEFSIFHGRDPKVRS